MNAILLAGHGSRRAEANDELLALARRVADAAGRAVAVGFLEFGQPTCQAACRELVAAGATGVTVVPVFLARGRHVHTDVPALVRELKTDYPDVGFNITPHLGAWDGLPGALAGLAQAETDR